MATNGASLQQIYNRLNSAPAYHPLQADTFADWSLEAGDIVTVSRDGANYESPVHSAKHVWKGHQEIQIASGGDEKRAPVARVSRQKYNSGGSGVRNTGYLYREIVGAYNGMSSLVVQTESVWSAKLIDAYNGLESYVEQTASHWQSTLNDAYNGLTSIVEQTASHWTAQLNDAYNGLSSTVEQTASRWTAQLNDAYNGLSSTVEQTASRWSSQLTDAYNGLSSTVEQTASHWSSQLQDTYNGLSSQVVQTASSWSTKISGVVDENGNVTAASISVAINEAGSEARIDADKVYIGNSKSTTVISGKLDAEDVTADYIAGKISDIGNLQTLSLTVNGNASIASGYYITADNYYFRSSPAAISVKDGICDVQISGPSSNTYKLQYKKFGDSSWSDAGSFSRAISSASWGWANGYPTVTLSPQNQSFNGNQITHGTPYWDSTAEKWKMEIQAIGSGTPPTYTDIGHTVNLSNYLQDKTGTNKITSNGTYTPSSGKIGFSEVEVDVQTAITSASWTWSNGYPTVTLSPQNQSFNGNQITHGTPYWDSTAEKWKMEIQAIGSGTPPTYTNIGHTVNLSNYLESKTISESTTTTFSNTYTPSSGKIGFSSVSVSVTATHSATATISSVGSTEPSGISGLGDLGTITPQYAEHWYTVTAKCNNANSKPYKLKVAPVTETKTITGSTSSTFSGTYTPASGKVGFSSVTVSVTATHSPTATIASNGTSEPSGISGLGTLTAQSVTSSPHWFTITASCGGSSKPYKLKMTPATETKDITSNGTYTPASGKVGFSKVTVNVTDPHTFGEKTFSSNGTYYASTYGYSGLSKVIVSVNTATESQTFTSNGTYTPSSGKIGFSSVTVNVAEPTIGISRSEATVNAGSSVTIYAKKNNTNLTDVYCTVYGRSIGYITTDANNNHNGDWWNFRCYTQKGGTLVCSGQTNASTLGMYVPGSGQNHTLTGLENRGGSDPGASVPYLGELTSGTSDVWIAIISASGTPGRFVLKGVTTPTVTHNPTCGYSSATDTAPSGAALLFSTQSSSTKDKYYKVWADCGGRQKDYYIKVEKKA